MTVRILGYRGKTHANCNKAGCGKMVECDHQDFVPDTPCPEKRIVPPRQGVDEPAAEVPCGGTLVLVPMAKIWGGTRFDFVPQAEILGIPCEGRRVCAVQTTNPEIATINDLVRTSTNWFWEEDLEAALKDRDTLGVLERNPEVFLSFLETFRDEVRETLGFKPLKKEKDEEK